MYVVAVNGSPRKGGNTERLLKAALAPLVDAGWKTDLVQVGGQPVRGCIACGKCGELKNKQCIQKDLFNDLMAKLVEADAIVITSYSIHYTKLYDRSLGSASFSLAISPCTGRLVPVSI